MHTTLRGAALTAGAALAAMAVIAPFAVMVALPAGNLKAAALAVLVVAVLDVVAAIALYPVLRSGGELAAAISVGLRVAYAAVFATAAGALVDGDKDRFQATWDAGLLVFGAHLLVVGLVAVASGTVPRWIGYLVAIAGAGYIADAVLAVLTAAPALKFGQFAFVGEVVLLIWLLGWCGRVR